MSTTLTNPPEQAHEKEPRIYRVGTLSYTQEQLFTLFFWLMWNDFTIMLLEKVNAFSGFLQLDRGATNTQVAIFGTIAGLFTIWINPVFSVWSDRTRTRWGRRRPFLLLTTPPLALCIVAIPYMPTLYHYLMRYPLAARFFHHVPMDGAVFMIGCCTILLSVFNAMVLAIFSYLYWDVVPQEVLGRWTALTRIVGAVGGLLWSFFLFGLADHHMKAVCVGVSVFCLVVYLISVWKVQEGDYPPVDEHKHGGLLAPVFAYFVECFSDPFYLWVFGAFLITGMNNYANVYRGYYLRYDLHLSYNVMGKLDSAPLILSIILGYFFGSLADRLHPMRVFAPACFAWGLVCLGSFFFIHDQWTYLFWSCLLQVAIFAYGVTYGALLPQIYPREKFGQFCSANALCGSVVGAITATPIGYLFDRIHCYRFAYMWSAFFLFAGGFMFLKVARNFEKRHGNIPVPHAG